ncbi:MAG: hypothetical protein IKE31_10645 [Eubacterium sp.]|nr:hypothetical protein [Eubacterium sp.]
MIALQVENVKDFMNKLLLKPVFDHYRVSEATITTFTTFSIDGQLHPEFYDPETIAPSSETQVSWESIRPFCLSVFKGKRLPLAFHFVLQLPQEQIPDFLLNNDLSLAPEDVFGLFLNIQYRGNVLTVTTGSSLRVFSGNRDLDRAWDQAVRDFLEREELN